jgi:hypothetical protein
MGDWLNIGVKWAGRTVSGLVVVVGLVCLVFAAILSMAGTVRREFRKNCVQHLLQWLTISPLEDGAHQCSESRTKATHRIGSPPLPKRRYNPPHQSPVAMNQARTPTK